jgi:hypothetical protein
MIDQCKTCAYLRNECLCNRVVVDGGLYSNDKLASQCLKKDSTTCDYYIEGKGTTDNSSTSWWNS